MATESVTRDPPAGRYTRDKEFKKKQLIEAAIAVFSERGYEKATTRELAERAGCAEGLIYKHFGGKRELLFAALRSQAGNPPDLGQPVAPDATVEQEMVGLLRRRVDHIWKVRDFVRVAMSLAAIDPELGHLVEEMEKRDVNNIAARLRTLQEAGKVGADVDIEAMATSIDLQGFGFAFLWRVVFERKPGEVDRKIVAIAKQLSDAATPR